MTVRKHNYLNNKDILKEIHKSKTTYCSYPNPEDHAYDMIVDSVKAINKKRITEARKLRAERLAKLAHEEATASGEKRKLDEFEIKPSKIPVTDIVFRVMTWDHVPIDDVKTAKARANAKEAFYDEEDEIVTEYDELDPKHNKYVKCNFPPFQHYKITEESEPYCVGKSHWKGDLETGEFNRDHGKMTNKLAHMFMKLCERYATRSNWRGYCVDTATDALTQDGWKNIDTISEQDIILSYDGEHLAWSAVKSIFRGEFDGLMHHITSRGMDALITPNHKLLTKRGLVPAELILENDRIILMGSACETPGEAAHSDALAELAGWVVTEGCYDTSGGDLRSITVYQNPGIKADRIRNCLVSLNYKFTESLRKNCIAFRIHRAESRKLAEILPGKNLTMEFILSLTQSQRELLIQTMVDGDGWTRANGNRSWTQKSPERTDMFQALCTITGIKTNTKFIIDHPSFGNTSDFFTTTMFASRGNTTSGACLNYHGGKRNGRKHIGLGKVAHPNVPTTSYQGRVWCPETEFGSFMARRNGKIYLTGNTYNDEMRSQALLQLAQIGLQFDEAKSQNPFAYYTAAITNSFTRVLNIEKRNQNIRDDILEMNNLNPSYTRQNSGGSSHYEE